eukprot:scaffold10090_cov18-Tisochrysis_lutea.AAC.1
MTRVRGFTSQASILGVLPDTSIQVLPDTSIQETFMSLQGLARPSTLNPALFYDCTGRALHKQVLEHSNPQLSMCARVFKKGKGPGGLSATGEGRNISNLLHLIKVALR